MEKRQLLLGFALALLVVTSGVTAWWAWQIYSALPGLGHPFGGPDEVTAAPSPGATGPYRVCEHDYDLARSPDQWGFGRIYAPAVRPEQCDELRRGQLFAANRDFNLVIIAHADGEGEPSEAHLNYQELARHLASNALMVVGINRYATQTAQGADAIFAQLLELHLEYLYDSSPIRNAITDHIALIGHSAGGRSVLRHSQVVPTSGHSLRAVVLLAPTMSADDTASFNGFAGAFLGLSVVEDSDFNAYGGKPPDQPMASNFRIYDEVGITGNPGIFTLEKDMVFVRSNAPIGAGSHYFQNQPFALAYINAFLQQYLNGHGIFERFLKYQERPAGISPVQVPDIWQQHEDTTRLTLANFENGLAGQTALGGSIDYANGIDNETVDQAEVIDPFSPHNSSVLYFETAPGQHRVTFDPPGSLDLSGYARLGLRITQVYHPVDNLTGGDLDFEIRLHDAAGSAAVSVSAHGGPLHFPAVVAAPLNPQNAEPGVTQENGQTKNAMRSYLVRLSAFAGIDLAAVDRVELDLGSGPGGQALIVDDVAFYGF